MEQAYGSGFRASTVSKLTCHCIARAAREGIRTPLGLCEALHTYVAASREL